MDWEEFASPEALSILEKAKPKRSLIDDFANPKKALAVLNGAPDNEQYARETMAATPLPKWATAGLNEGASDVWSAALRIGMNSNPAMWGMGKIPLPELPEGVQKEFGLKNSPKNIGELASERADALNRYSDAFERAAAETDVGAAGFAAKAARGVTRSLPPAILAGATMGPYGAIGYGVATEANQAVTEGKDAGLTGSKLAAYATAQGAIEGTISAAFQKVGLGGMEKVFTKSTGTALKSGFKDAFKELGYRTLQEVPEELMTEAGHAVASRVAGVTKETDWKSLAIDTVAQTALTMGLVETPSLAKGVRVDRQWANRGKQDTATAMARPEAAQAWATANPEAAARMAAIESPSRRDFREITGEKWTGNPASRKAFADNVRAAVGTAVENPTAPLNPSPDATESGSSEGSSRDPRWHYGKTPQKLPPTPEQLADTVGSTMSMSSDPTPDQTAPQLKVGDPVQWTVNGADQFPEPRKVTNISPDGKFAFVEGATTGVPVEQLSPTVEQVTAFSTPKVDYSLKDAPQTPPTASEPAPASLLPPDLVGAADDELASLIKNMGGKPPAKFPKQTYRARLEADVAAMFKPPPGKVTFDPITPEQRAPVATPSESNNASIPRVSLEETPQPVPEQPPAQEAVVPSAATEQRRAAVLSAFRGQATKAVELPAAENHRGGYRVEFANGQFVDILHKDTIPGDREGIRRSLVGQLGREPTDDEIADHGPSAAFVVRDDEGRELPGLGAMHIALDTPSATAYRHEALHMARRNNQISVAEWRLLKEKHAPGLNDAEAEERIANSAEAWSDPTIGDRVRVFFHKLLEALGMLDAKTVEALIKTGEVFNRKANRTPAPNTVTPKRTFPRKPAAAPTPAAEPLTGATGRSTTITAGEKKYPAEYRVVDLESITPSHDFWRGSPKDNVEDGKFPAGLQPRDYNKAEEKMKVRERSRAEESHYFLEDTQRADGGPPTVSKSGIAFNGNGRVMMLQMAAGENRYDWYKNALKAKAQAFGIDPAEVEGKKHPILVRVVDLDPSSKEGEAFAAAGNTTATMSQSSLRTASSLAKLIDADLLDSVPTNDESSFSDIVAGGATGKDFRAMVYKAIPAGERPRYFNTDQTLTSDGKELVRNMLLTRILPVDVVEKLNADRKQMGNAIEKALPVLLKLSSKPVLFKQFSKAVGYLADHPDARTKATLDDVFRQRGFLDDDRLTSREKMFAEFVLLKSSTPNKFRDALRQMLADLRAGRGLLAEASADTGVLMADALGVEHRKGGGGTFQVRERPLKWDQKPYGTQAATYGRNQAFVIAPAQVSFIANEEGSSFGDWAVQVNGSVNANAGLSFATESDAKQAADTILKHHMTGVADVFDRLQENGIQSSKLDAAVDMPGLIVISRKDQEVLDKIEAAMGTDDLGDVVRNNVPAWLGSVLHVDQDSGEVASLMETIYKYPDAWENIWERLYELKQNLKHDGKGATQDAFVELVQTINTQIAEGEYDTEGHIPAPMYQTRRRRANPGTTPPVRKLVEKHEDTYVPPYRSDAQDDAEVEKRLSDDYEGEKKRLMAFAPGSDYFDRTDVLAAKKIINREAAPAIQRNDMEAIRQAVTLIDAYRRQGSEQAAAFRNRRDPIETPDQRVRRNLVEAVLTPPKKDQERIDKALADGNDALAQKIRDDWAKKFEEMKRKLKALGVDLDNLNEYGYDPIKAAQAINVVATAKAGAWDKAYEYWRNAILSGLGTHIVNPGSALVHGARKLMIDRTVEAMLNTVIGRKEGAQLGELKHLYAGVLPGMMRGMRNAQLAFRTEKQQLERQLDKKSEYDVDTSDAAIGGSLGRKVRIPQRMLLAEDEFVKSMFATMDAGAQAYRIAKGEGLSGKPMERRIENLVNDLESPAWSQAYDTALDISFQQKGSATGQAIKEIGITARRKIKPLHFLIPFVTTPVNIFETGIRRAPLTGDAAMAYKMYENYKAGRSPLQGMTPRIAERVLAWATVLALWGLTGDEDDEPWITGSTPPRNRGARDLSRRTYPANSIRIGNAWHSYSRIEPFATSLALTVDSINAIKSGKGLTHGAVASLYGQMKDKTFLDGIGDMQRALESEDVPTAMREWGSSFAVSWVPNIARSTARAVTDKFPERGIWGKGEDRTGRTLKRMLQKTELGFGYGDHPSIDLWGREAKRGTSPIFGTDIPWRILTPSERKVPDIFVGDKAILNWNAQHHGAEIFPQLPDKKLTLTKPMLDHMKDDDARAAALKKMGGKERSMTDAEYETFMRLSGGAAKSLVEKLNINADKPTEADMDAIRKAISDAREVANATMIQTIVNGNATPSADTLASELFSKEIERQADALSRAKPLKLADRKKWFADREAALQWLRAKGVSGQDVLTTYLPELKKIKTDTTRAEKRDRLKAALRGL